MTNEKMHSNQTRMPKEVTTGDNKVVRSEKQIFEVCEKMMLNNSLCLKLITAEKRNAVIEQQRCKTKQMSFFLGVHEM